MPTPVTTAKQCLNSDASHALDEAVSLARRRGHSQTTSLHAVSAFLSLSPSQLREACIRARNTAFYPRVQLKALDFCLSVSLDRLPTSPSCLVELPSVSNSLMAAIKRSQANQRRQPDGLVMVKSPNQHLSQAHEQVGATPNGVKVELQCLIVSILDDPIVSRVFLDAGFRSFDVKMALLRPFQSLIGYSSRLRGHHGGYFGNFSWGRSGSDEDEDYKRIGEVMVRKKGRNPLLVGSNANDVLRGFVEVLEKKKESNFLPLELSGMSVISIENDVMKSLSGNFSDEAIDMRFKGLDLMVEHCLGPGLIISVGKLCCFISGENGFVMDSLNSVVRKLSKLLCTQGSRVWLIGSAANDQTYLEFLSKFPSIDKDWDLQLLPITSVKASIGESCFKSSLSFVPFGGFFSSPSDFRFPFSSSCQYITRSNLSDEKLEHDVSTFSRGGFMASTADQSRTALSSCLPMAKVGVNNTLDNPKAAGGMMLQPATTPSSQRKWDNVGRDNHHDQSSQKPDICRDFFQNQTTAGSHDFDAMLNINKPRSFTNDISGKECNNRNINSCMSINISIHSTCEPSKPLHYRSLKNVNFLNKLAEGPSKTEHTPDFDIGQTSPSSAVSVVTDLGLELFSQPFKQQKRADDDAENSIQLNPNHVEDNNWKTLYKALFESLGRQCEAVRVISQVVASSWTFDGKQQKSGHRGDIWLNFLGPDMFGQRKIALALAEVLYGSKNDFIHVDLCPQDMVPLHKSGCSLPLFGSNVKFRGKTIVDHIAEELREKPSCVVFLENVFSADPLVQHSLSQAITNGRFSDSHGREVMTNNRIFILSSGDTEKLSNSDMERLARAKCYPLQIFVKDFKNHLSNKKSALNLNRSGENIPDKILWNKRKLNGKDETIERNLDVGQVKRPNRRMSVALDLNLPATATEDDSGITGDNESWLDWLPDQVGKTLVKVVFDPFDYDELAERVFKWVNESFQKVVGSDCLLEVERTAMEQMLAAACLSECDKDVEKWIDQVLSKGFAEAQKRYQLTTDSVVVLATCDAVYAEEMALEGYLPLKIILTRK